MFLMIIYNDITCYVLDDHFEKMIFELADAARLRSSQNVSFNIKRNFNDLTDQTKYNLTNLTVNF